MAQYESSLKVLEHCLVSPPPGSIPQPSAPPAITFFDLQWLPFHSVQRLFFYSYHHNTTHFINTTLPDIKHSLSLTLQNFYPLAGVLTWPANSTKPQIEYGIDQENSGANLTIAETNLDFNNLVGNHPRDVHEFYPLVPQLIPVNKQVDQVPVMGLQVTLFPDIGICIGISVLHGVADGKTTTHFMKSWASACKSGLGDTACLVPASLPSYDRSKISDPNNWEKIYLDELATLGISQPIFYVARMPTVETERVRATFVLSRSEIQKLQKSVLCQFDEMYKNGDMGTPPPPYLSSFVLTTAYVWSCLTKVLPSDMEREHLVFAIECRERVSPPMPPSYFGNCLMPCYTDVKRSNMIGEDGIAFAAEAIRNSIQKMTSEGVLEGGEQAFAKYKYLLSKERFLSITGSPKLGVYGIDFGWGKPKKVEVTSIEATGSMSLGECGDGEGGVEVGLVLGKLEMDAFTSLFTNSISVL